MNALERTFVGAVLATALSSACVEKDTSTQITVALAAETEIPRELDTIQVVVIDAKGSEIYRNEYPVSYARFFPTTLAIVPRDDDSLDRPVTIEVRGYKQNESGGQVFRRAIVPFFKGRTLLVPMPLRMACFNFVDCKANETCAGGRCVPAQLEASTLLEYQEQLVFGGAPNATCFDEAACLGKGTLLSVAPDCTFALPEPSGADVNVSIRWAAAEGRVIGLDGDDPIEGWTRVDARTGRLSAGVCDSLLDPEPNPKSRRVPDKALDARISTACPTKTREQPNCPGGDGQTGIGTALRP
ncbi:hypothetical protein BH11MYX4_BH11MYX4_49220 [soil metagenome]